MDNNIENTELSISIERLVLKGISLTFYEQQQLREAVEIALAGMFLVNGTPKELADRPAKIVTDPIQLQGRKPAPEQLGKQIAASIYHGLSGERSGK